MCFLPHTESFVYLQLVLVCLVGPVGLEGLVDLLDFVSGVGLFSLGQNGMLLLN